MTIKFKVSEQKRQELAKEISTWLDMPIQVQGENLDIDIFSLTRDGTLVFYEKTDSEMVERLLEHLHDCGFETEELNSEDEKSLQIISELHGMMDMLAAKVAFLEKECVVPLRILELRQELSRICQANKTRQSGIDFLVNYYMESLQWSEEVALKYAISLFHNGIIQQIKVFNKEGKQI